MNTYIPDFALGVEVACRSEIDEVSGSAEVNERAFVAFRPLFHARNNQVDKGSVERGCSIDDNVMLFAQRPDEVSVGE